MAVINAINNTLTGSTIQSYTESIITANSGTAFTLNLANNRNWELTLTGNCTFSFSNVPVTGAAVSMTIDLIQDGTGSRTVTWPGSVIWPGGTAPTLTTTANHADTVVLRTYNGGTTWRAALSAANYSS